MDFNVDHILSFVVCIGGFQPYPFDTVQANQILFDIILGMSFLRNAYMVGNMTNGTVPSKDTAYIQLLPITNATQAAQDFKNVTQSAGNSTGTKVGSQLSSHPSSSSSSKFSLKPWLIGLVAGIGLLILLAAGVVCCCRRRRTKNAPATNPVWAANTSSYHPITNAAYDMHMIPAAPPG